MGSGSHTLLVLLAMALLVDMGRTRAELEFLKEKYQHERKVQEENRVLN